MILYILLGIIGMIVVSGIIFVIYKIPKQQTKRIKDFESKKWEAENEFRKTLIQIVGGLVVIFGLIIALVEVRNFQLAQENMKAGQIANRFSKAIELISKEKDTTARIGGIYALEQIAKESPKEYLGTVIEVLAAFVRNAKVEVIHVDAEKVEEKKRNRDKKRRGL